MPATQRKQKQQKEEQKLGGCQGQLTAWLQKGVLLSVRDFMNLF